LLEYILLAWLIQGSHCFTQRPEAGHAEDAADYITKLPKKESDVPEWQRAIEVLMLVSRGGPTIGARH
jgi:hypothetical protein